MRIKPARFSDEPALCVYWRPIIDPATRLVSHYRKVPYLVKPFAGSLERAEVGEAETLVNQFLEFSRLSSCEGIYLRCDCYIGSDGVLQMLEINSISTDGWGPAWHLARIIGSSTNCSRAFFPRLWTTYDLSFKPALRLACAELRLMGREARVIDWQSALNAREPVYAYLQNGPREFSDHFVPKSRELEDKLRFARFSHYWQGQAVKIPRFYWYETDFFQNLVAKMGQIIFKRRAKYSASNKESVLFSSAKHNPVDLIDALEYLRGDVVAQDVIETMLVGDLPVQVILLFAPTHDFSRLILAGGYLQIAPAGTRVINDIAAHGPLIFSCHSRESGNPR